MDLLEYLLVLVRNRWLIIRNVIIFTLISLVVSLVIPKKYKPTATVIPVNMDVGGISSLLSGYSLNVFDRSVIIPEAFRVILRSQAMMDSLISRYDLFEVYGKKYKEHVYQELEKNIELEVDKEVGIGYSPIAAINVSVIGNEPERTTEMTNFCVDFLYDKIRGLNSHYVEKKFNFIENRYLKSVADVNAAEVAMKLFQDEYGLIEIEEQLKLMIQKLAEFEAEKEKMEIELAVLAASYDTSNPLYKKAKTNLEVMKERINQLKSGADFANNESVIFYPTSILPELAMRYFTLYRDVEVKNKILEMMTIQYEQIKIQIGKDIPSMLILDYAQVPTYKYKPKRILIVLGGFLISLLISIAYVFFMNFYITQKSDDTDYYRKLDEMRSLIISDFKKSK
jgi:capsule polysaccharide export protein KpsE/RkpR